jgi:hypothetical protein
MRPVYPVYPMTLRVLGVGAALLSGSAIAQQPDAMKFNQGYESAVGKARQVAPRMVESVKAPGATTAYVPTKQLHDSVQQGELSDELQIALRANRIDTIDTYLHRYPDSERRIELLGRIASIRRSEFKEWIMFDVGGQRTPHYMRLSSIDQFDNKVAVQWKFRPDSSEGLFRGKQFPDGVNVEDAAVFDCTEPVYALSERAITGKSGEVLFHYKWADSRFLILSNGPKLAPGSVAMSARNIACHEELRTPLVGKLELASPKYPSLVSAIAGDRDMFYIPIKDGNRAQNQITVTTVIRWHEDRKISAVLPAGTSIAESSQYRFQVAQAQIYCAENKMSVLKEEYYTASNDLVYLAAVDPSKVRQVYVNETSPYGELRRIVCGLNEVRQ